jgi:hypothetical protein
MAVYWSKHVKDNKLKRQNLTFTLDGVLKILFTWEYTCTLEFYSLTQVQQFSAVILEAFVISLHTLTSIQPTCNFFLISIVGGGVQTGSTRHVGCPGWLWGWRICWNEWQGKPKYSEKTCPCATLSTTNPTWPDTGLNPGRRGGKPATNRFSYGAANHLQLTAISRVIFK